MRKQIDSTSWWGWILVLIFLVLIHPVFADNHNMGGLETITTTPVKPMVGGVITFNLTGTYPSGSVFTWAFGDGTSEMSDIPGIEHQYLKTGLYIISVTVNGTEVATKTLDLTLMKGDILAHAAEGVVSALIPGMWSHVGMYIGNDTILESTAEGVHKSDVSVWAYPHDTCDAVFRLTGIDTQTREQVVAWALTKEHRPYDIGSILSYQKQPDCNQSWNIFCNRYYCSELVWAAYYRNGIDLDPLYGAVLPRTVVTGKRKPTELVGSHIEKIPPAFSHYQKIYDQIQQGNNPPYDESSVQDDSNSQLIILGSTETLADHAGTASPDSDGGITVFPGSVTLHITDPRSNILSKELQTIPNASIGRVDADGDGFFTDEMAGIFNPVPGEYRLNISIPDWNDTRKPISLDVGIWDSDQYEWVHPHDDIPICQIENPMYFRVDETEGIQVITIPSRGKAPLNVSCMEMADEGGVNNTWDFGDGTTTSDRMTVNHRYGEPGTYTICLESWNNGTRSILFIPITVEEDPAPLVADFIVDNLTGTPPLTVSFQDRSMGNPVYWNWNFGDGSSSHDQNPVHTYMGIGRYTVTLEVSSQNGEQSVIRKPEYITPVSDYLPGPSGVIQVSSSPPGAIVTIDGTDIGVTPLESAALPAGSYHIRLLLGGYHEWSGIVKVKQGGYTLVPTVILQPLTEGKIP